MKELGVLECFLGVLEHALPGVGKSLEFVALIRRFSYLNDILFCQLAMEYLVVKIFGLTAYPSALPRS